MSIKTVFLSILFLLMAIAVRAEVTLPSIFADNMVLQRNDKVLLWGWSDTDEEITVVTGWDNRKYTFKTPITAKWELEVETPAAGGPYTLEFKGNGDGITLENIMIGEVWLCSGQSNMQWSATTNAGITNGEEEIKNADYPDIRLFTVERRTAPHPQENLPGTWQVCSPETMKDFSAIAYFFARRLQGELNVPIGLIDNAWGGSPAEVWASKSVFDEDEDLKVAAEALEESKWNPVDPSVLFNAMVYPIKAFKIAGTIWYQGESNVGRYAQYIKLFSEMVASWREAWGYEFPFYYVQIAPFKYEVAEEGAYLRDAQRRAMNVIPNSGMAVVSDIATVDDIHPPNKQDVGLRLANMALKDHYRHLKEEVYGPFFKEIKIDGNRVQVVFDHAQGLYSEGKKLTQFEVAGADGRFYPAKAKIKDDTVLVTSKKVEAPKHVRFGWSNTDEAELFNAAGLPASIFSTQPMDLEDTDSSR